MPRQARPRRSISLWDRFWAKVQIPEDLRACWIWQGAKGNSRLYRKQYGIIRKPGREGGQWMLTHRQVCLWVHGPAPEDKPEAGHTCPEGENGLCVNPQHLRWQSRAENEAYKRGARRAAD